MERQEKEECRYRGVEIAVIPKILISRPRKAEVNNITINRTWRRRTPPALSDAVLTMKRRNYKVYADVGLTPSSKLRVSKVLETGFGPGFVRRDQLTPSGPIIRPGNAPMLHDAGGRPINIVGITTLQVLFVSSVENYEFNVCERLSVS